MPLSLSFTTLDVFTSKRFAGNPLAIVNVPPHTTLSQATKQEIAREFNFSETVFLHEDDGALDGRRVDIFTIAEELPFAGHPTIGTLCYIASQTVGAPQRLRLLCKAGTIHGTYDHGFSTAEADVPHKVHVHTTQVDLAAVLASQPGLRTAMDADADQGPYPKVAPVAGMQFVLVPVPRPEGLARVGRSSVPIHRMEEGAGFVAPYYYTLEACYITGDGEEDGECVMQISARMVEPEIGEDPATGSAACALGCYFAIRAGGRGRKFRFDIAQGVEMGRESKIGVRVVLNAEGTGVEKVFLSGTAVLVTRGEIEV
ncbi:hypothetical protein MMC13_000007 [Lambiella insularis]|nr:hypothetical protein [Lambiella insularis]